MLEGRSVGQVLAISFFSVPDRQTPPQLNAIPTVGFSDPILSYFSALQFNFDGVRMLREGYEKVIPISLNTYTITHIGLTAVLLSDKTRFIQNCQFS